MPYPLGPVSSDLFSKPILPTGGWALLLAFCRASSPLAFGSWAFGVYPLAQATLHGFLQDFSELVKGLQPRFHGVAYGLQAGGLFILWQGWVMFYGAFFGGGYSPVVQCLGTTFLPMCMFISYLTLLCTLSCTIVFR